jgi:hypothetical protein
MFNLELKIIILGVKICKLFDCSKRKAIETQSNAGIHSKYIYVHCTGVLPRHAA